MRKKLYLVALFCGALCLTGCLKNEESASVTQVRFAKANELNSIAALNNAKAQAAIIAAEADAALKASEAKINEAEAKLREAQAAYKDAETQLKLVEVALKEVEVQIKLVELDEEKIELEKKKLELEEARARLEAAKAEAEAEKAFWVAQLEDIQRDAEIEAAEDALALRQAQQDIEDYAAQLDADKADAITNAADRYFDALNTVTTLNTQFINAVAELAKSDYDKNAALEDQQDFIADLQIEVVARQAAIEELKQLATMTQEEVEAAEEAAEAALVAALEDYRAAQDAQEKAEDAMDENLAKHSKFYDAAEHDWHDFDGMLQFAANYVSSEALRDEIVEGYDETYEMYGFIEPNDDPAADPVFVPLFNYEKTLKNLDKKNPDPSVYGDADLYVAIRDWKIVPATINYDNVKHLEDLSLAKVKAEVDEKINDPETGLKAKSAKKVAGWQEDIAKKTDELNLHKAYVAERAEEIANAETALTDAIDQYNTDKNSIAAARKAYQEYMVVKYDISRTLFEDLWDAIDDTLETSAAYWTAKANYEALAAALPGLETAKNEAWQAEQDAKQDYIDAKAAYDSDPIHALIDAQKVIWNPDFTWEESTTSPYYKNVANAGSSQTAMLGKYEAKVVAEKTLATKKAAYDADPTNATKKAEYLAAVGDHAAAVEDLNLANINMNAEGAKYNSLVNELTPTKQALDDAIAKWNPDFDASTEPNEKNEEGEWVRGTNVAGTTQAEELDTWVAWDECNTQVTKYHDADGNRTARKEFTEAQAAHQPKLDAFNAAWAALTTALGVDPDTYEGDAEARTLWDNTKIAALAWSDVVDKFTALTALYTKAIDPPYIDKVGWFISNFEIDPYSEYIYQIDNSEEPAVAVKRYIAAGVSPSYIKPNNKPKVSLSLSNKIEVLEQKIADEPEALAEAIAIEEEKIAWVEEKIAEVNEKIDAYKQYEAEYTEWVASREADIEAWNEAKLATFAAKAAYKIAAEEYEAAHGDFFNVLLKDVDGNPIMSGGEYQIVELNVQECIADIEEQIALYEEWIADEQHELWEMQIDYEAWAINQAQDIAVLQEKIEIYSAIAEYYKNILDGLMEAAGIVPNAEEVPAE